MNNERYFKLVGTFTPDGRCNTSIEYLDCSVAEIVGALEIEIRRIIAQCLDNSEDSAG